MIGAVVISIMGLGASGGNFTTDHGDTLRGRRLWSTRLEVTLRDLFAAVPRSVRKASGFPRAT